MYTSKVVYEFISTQTRDPIVERKICRISGTQFPIYQSDLDFYTKISPTFSGQKYIIPTPTLCPEERQRRRSAFRNERKLYKRTCAATNVAMISMYSPDKAYTVYDQSYRRSDKRDPLTYGREFDFSKTFTEQMHELMYAVPRQNFYGVQNENSAYTNHTSYSKNCYMCADMIRAQDCLYSTTGVDSTSLVDCELMTSGDNCYECVDCDVMHTCFFCRGSNNCSNCWYLTDCSNCTFCYECTNLVGAKYCIENKQYDETTYHLMLEKRLAARNKATGSIEGIKQNMRKIQSDTSFGNQIFTSDKAVLSYLVYEAKNIKYSHVSGWVTDAYDCYETGMNCSLMYENHAVTGSSSVYFASISYDNSYSYYIDNCYNNSHIFGCVGVRNKQYCIFNKQYTKEEYEKTVAKIISHMQETGERGEFFHPSLSPFGYNETVAHEYFSLTEQEAKNRAYKRSTYNADPVIPAGVQVIDYREPQRVRGTGQKEKLDALLYTAGQDKEIATCIYICEISGRPFRLVTQELDFYRKHKLPLPRQHPDVRHAQRIQRRPGRILYLSTCDCCRKEMLSVYPQEYTGKVYCEDCYKKEVYA